MTHRPDPDQAAGFAALALAIVLALAVLSAAA